MTKAEITVLNSGFIFECSGHAGFAEKGSDIVCAGISALCMALMNRLSVLAREDIVSVEYCHISDAEVYIEVGFADNGACAVRALEVLETVRAGLEKIEELYPEHLSLLC